MGVKSLRDIYGRCSFALTVSDPFYYEDAAVKEEWRQAMKEEMESIRRNQTWDLVDLPSDKQAISLKWVYKTKFGSDGSVQGHKARLIAKGYAQEYGVDYEKVYAPVAIFETMRLVIALAAQRKWLAYQLDIKSAFLNGGLQEDVYVSQP